MYFYFILSDAPGPITNATLLDKNNPSISAVPLASDLCIQASSNASEMLKDTQNGLNVLPASRMRKRAQFRMVTISQWSYLQKIYGGGPAICLSIGSTAEPLNLQPLNQFSFSSGYMVPAFAKNSQVDLGLNSLVSACGSSSNGVSEQAESDTFCQKQVEASYLSSSGFPDYTAFDMNFKSPNVSLVQRQLPTSSLGDCESSTTLQLHQANEIGYDDGYQKNGSTAHSYSSIKRNCPHDLITSSQDEPMQCSHLLHLNDSSGPQFEASNEMALSFNQTDQTANSLFRSAASRVRKLILNYLDLS
ncbi:unnamed protein product [Protopolystoma xenopodis]|uniref:Uncharacterized protein n=1 Tax=Protopolystoma xenopodis TaxID=117903 RepID=A0A3S5BA48_9PLAT|nr:unnamed protein product [Protopolystoma xenopodis]